MATVPVGVKLKVPMAIGVLPDGTVYQSAVAVPITVAVSVGKTTPIQADTFVAITVGFSGTQLQFGALNVVVAEQEVALKVAVMF